MSPTIQLVEAGFQVLVSRITFATHRNSVEASIIRNG